MKNITKFNRLYYYFLNRTLWRYCFETIGSRSVVFAPMQINSKRAIRIGEKCFIGANSWLLAVGNGKIEINNNCTIGHFSHFAANSQITICNDVLIADRVFISDNTHSYEDINTPIIMQELKELKPVVIGEGSWIGENVCICGASIGKHCVVGANSVVISDIPDYCVAVGCPAKVVKKYDFISEEWVKI